MEIVPFKPPLRVFLEFQPNLVFLTFPIYLQNIVSKNKIKYFLNVLD